jgi:hypothetical protein
MALNAAVGAKVRIAQWTVLESNVAHLAKELIVPIAAKGFRAEAGAREKIVLKTVSATIAAKDASARNVQQAARERTVQLVAQGLAAQMVALGSIATALLFFLNATVLWTMESPVAIIRHVHL